MKTIKTIKTAKVGPSYDLSPIKLDKMDKSEIRDRIKEIDFALRKDPEYSQQNSHARSVLLHRKKLLESKLESHIRNEWRASYEELSPKEELAPSFALFDAVNIFYKLAAVSLKKLGTDGLDEWQNLLEENEKSISQQKPTELKPDKPELSQPEASPKLQENIPISETSEITRGIKNLQQNLINRNNIDEVPIEIAKNLELVIWNWRGATSIGLRKKGSSGEPVDIKKILYQIHSLGDKEHMRNYETSDPQYTYDKLSAFIPLLTQLLGKIDLFSRDNIQKLETSVANFVNYAVSNPKKTRSLEIVLDPYCYYKDKSIDIKKYEEKYGLK